MQLFGLRFPRRAPAVAVADPPAAEAPQEAASTPPALPRTELLSGLTPASHLGSVTPQGASVRVDGGAQAWAFGAFTPFEFEGRALVTVTGTGLKGQMGVGLINHARDEVFGEQVFTVGVRDQKIRIAVNDASAYAGVMIRTNQDGAVAPSAVIDSITIEPMRPYLDPFLESLWPLQGPEYSLGSLYGWSWDEL